MSETSSKKDKAKQKAKKKQDKADKMRDRKANTVKGKSLDDMMAYVDDDGNITSTPPLANRERKEISLDDIQLGAAPIIQDEGPKKGKLTFFNSTKGYGFITDDKTNESIFVHNSQLPQPVKEGDRLFYEKEKSPRGYTAVNVTRAK